MESSTSRRLAAITRRTCRGQASNVDAAITPRATHGAGEMRKGNWGRLAMAAAVASVIIFFVAGGVNGAILGGEWNAWAQALGPLNHAPSAGVGFIIWLIVAAIDGAACVWLYARLRA